MLSTEYLYWYDENAKLQYRIDDYLGMIHACRVSGAKHHWCYAPSYQFTSSWIMYNPYAGVEAIIRESDVPAEIRALHLLIYRG